MTLVRLGDVRTFLGFDLETTGVDVKTARIVSSSLVTYDKDTGAMDRDSSLVNPGVHIPESSSEIHGIYDKDVVGAPLWSDYVVYTERVIQAAWIKGAVLVGHNISYDLTVLDAELRRTGHYPEGFVVCGPICDTMVLHRKLGYKKATLDAATRDFGITNEGAHDAEEDVVATLKLLIAQIGRSSSLSQTYLSDLFIDQRGFHSKWASGLTDYFRRVGRMTQDESVCGDWPIQGVS